MYIDLLKSGIGINTFIINREKSHLFGITLVYDDKKKLSSSKQFNGEGLRISRRYIYGQSATMDIADVGGVGIPPWILQFEIVSFYNYICKMLVVIIQ